MGLPTGYARPRKVLATVFLVIAMGLSTASCSESEREIEQSVQSAETVNVEAPKIDASKLTDELLEMWTTTDADKRHELVMNHFTESAVQYVAPANVTFEGSKKIEANVAKVNKENIQRAGLTFAYSKPVVNHNSVQLKWQVAKGAKIVRKGTDFLVLDAAGRITRLYMFSGT